MGDYPVIPWDRMDLDQFNLIKHFPKMARRLLSLFGMTWQSFHLIPIESGRGCPYGCEFCTVTGFFGDSIRFRSNESVVNELLMLKALEKREKGKVAVFFIDDNFAINPRRTKSLLREIIARGAQVPWVAQISMNLLRDEELVSLIAQSGGRWIFMGLESIDPENLKSVSKGFNKPDEYQAVLERLARHNLYAITSFIFGMDGDRPGVAQRTLEAIRSWPPGLPVFGLLTPYPATPLYDRLAAAGRLTRPKHWLEFKPFTMAFTPLGITVEQAEAEVRQAWASSYSPADNRLYHGMVGIEVFSRPPDSSAQPPGLPGNLFSADEAAGLGARSFSKPGSHPPPARPGAGTQIQAAAARASLPRTPTIGRAHSVSIGTH